MSTVRAALSGIRLVAGSLWIVVVLWLLNAAVAAPVAQRLSVSLERSIGHSRAHVGLREGFDTTWYGEYSDSARGVEQTFGPAVVGGGAFYRNLDGWLSGDMFRLHPGLLALGLAYVLLWLWMMGGVLDRYAHPAEAGFRRFGASGRRFFLRFVRLALLAGVGYALVYRLGAALFGRVERAVENVQVEGTVLLYSLLVWGLVAILLGGIHVCFEYAKVATVVEDRRSMLLAAGRGAGFVLRYPVRALGLYYAWLLVAAGCLAVYAWLGPGARQSTTPALLTAFGISQLFIVVRLGIRLAMMAGATSLFRGLAGGAPSATTDVAAGPAVSPGDASGTPGSPEPTVPA